MKQSALGRAFLSVTDKTGIVALATALVEFGYQIVSTGGTATAIREGGVEVTDVGEITGFPEMMDGRIKSMHPRLLGGVLARRNNVGDIASCVEHDIGLVDVVAINLYNFAKAIAEPGMDLLRAIEQMDIGGPTGLRSAAKNFRWVTVLSSPLQYEDVLHEMRGNGGKTTLETRTQLAANAIRATADYDRMIADYFEAQIIVAG